MDTGIRLFLVYPARSVSCNIASNDYNALMNCVSTPLHSEVEQKWVCVRTEPHREAFAEAGLRRQGFLVYCPRYQRWIKHARKRTLVLRPLFPNYMFVSSEAGFESLGAVRRVPGVSSLAARDLYSASVSANLVDAIKLRENNQGAVELSVERFKPGEKVRLTEGALAGWEAIFAQALDHKRCLILMTFLGKQHRIKVDAKTLNCGVE